MQRKLRDDETWVEIPDFPGYAVSDRGRVLNTHTDLIKTPTPNQQGIASVLLMQNGVQCRRSVTKLVANAFLEPIPHRPLFDTPINLDGDRLNNAIENLEWRPRWFAAKYHAQFKGPRPFGFHGPVELIQTGEVFDDVRECAMRYGLLEKEIILAAHTKIPVFPTWQEFQLVS
jgi:hypothetical protein